MGILSPFQRCQSCKGIADAFAHGASSRYSLNHLREVAGSVRRRHASALLAMDGDEIFAPEAADEGFPRHGRGLKGLGHLLLLRARPRHASGSATDELTYVRSYPSLAPCTRDWCAPARGDWGNDCLWHLSREPLCLSFHFDRQLLHAIVVLGLRRQQAAGLPHGERDLDRTSSHRIAALRPECLLAR